jgi:hypothetical protein
VLKLVEAIRSKMLNNENRKSDGPEETPSEKRSVDENKRPSRSRSFHHPSSLDTIALPNASYACVAESWARYNELYGPNHPVNNRARSLAESSCSGAEAGVKRDEGYGNTARKTSMDIPDPVSKKAKQPLALASEEDQLAEELRKKRHAARHKHGRVDIRTFSFEPPSAGGA